MNFSRRCFGRTVAAWLFGGRLLKPTGGDPLSWVSLDASGAGLRRRYRADAQLILFSVPVLHRKGVGDGSAVWRESVTADGATERFLEFTGRSVPEHAAGLNRFGFIQELSRTTDRTDLESFYFGLMTSSPEDNAAEARKALHSNAKETSYSAIEGHIAAGSIETVSARFFAPARTGPGDRGQLIEWARVALSGASKKSLEGPSAVTAPRPFLHVLAGLLSASKPAQAQYEYNGRLYALHLEKSPDLKATSIFRGQGLIPQTAAVTRVSGTLRRQEGGKPSEFRLWIEEGARQPIPLRIEYQPKAYLRLTFEAEA